MKYIIFFISFLLILTSAPVYSTDRSDYIRQYFDYSGVTKGLRGMIDMQAEFTLKKISRKRNLSDDFQKDFREVWNDVMLDDFWASGGFFDILKPSLNDLTIDDLKEIVRFYQSQVGKKLAKLTQEMQGNMRALMPQWGKRISNVILPEILNRLEKRGWDKDGNKIR